MGRVFEYGQIENGSVPSSADFQAAAEAFQGECVAGIENGRISGAFIFGSVAGLLKSDPRVSPNHRSDMDCFVVLKDYSESSLRALRGVAQAVKDASKNKIVAEPIVYHRQQLENGHIPGMHELDPMFGTDLKGSGRFIIGEDPAEYMRFSEASPYTVFNAFIAHKRRKLHNGLAQDPESERGVRTVQRYLELPLSMGRKAVQALILDGQFDDESFWAADKSRVLKTAREELFATSARPAILMERILANDAAYSELLHQSMQGNVTQSEYTTALRDIADYTSGIEWIGYVHDSIRKRLIAPPQLTGL
jgi:hypothetical protein